MSLLLDFLLIGGQFIIREIKVSEIAQNKIK
uniref:Uncharacterized protein n=1 Tax=Geladintestivirus 6 TaxID=3233138 RepID=A0AAU8MKT5_9CAUD